MPRYRLTLEYDAASDTDARAICAAARLAFKSSHAHGVELLRETVRPWLRADGLYRVDPPGRIAPHAARPHAEARP